MQAEKVVSSTCPFCGVGCQLDLHMMDSRIIKADSPFDAPVNRGQLCVKGRFGWDFLYNPDRVTTPLIRKEIGNRKIPEGTEPRDLFREATWEEALDLVVERLAETRIQHGPDSLGVFCCAKATNEDNYLLQKMFRAVIGTNNVDHCTRLCHAGSVHALQMAIGSAAMSSYFLDVFNSDVFIITGSNTAETHPIVANAMKEAVHKHGARLIVIDPRRVEMAEHAEMWLCQRPGTDVPLFSAMAHVILKEGLQNDQFIEERTENLDEFAKKIEKFTPEYAEEITGVPAEQIRKAARMYAKADAAAIYWAMGLSQSTHGTDNVLTISNLALLTGQIGRPGTGLNPLRGQNNVQGASDAAAMPYHYPGYQRVDDPESQAKFEEAWGGPLSSRLGLATTEAVKAWGSGDVKAWYIMGENPMMTEPNLYHTKECLENLPFMVMQDLFINETGLFADVFLPAASFAEKDGTFTNTDRRVQRVRKALEPRGQARSDWEIVCDVAARLYQRLEEAGVRELDPNTTYSGARWDYEHPSEILEEMAAVAPSYAGITYNRIEDEGLMWPVSDKDHPGTPILFEESFPRGRGKFWPVDYTPSADMPDEAYPYVLSTGRVLYHWHGGTMTRQSRIGDAYPDALVEINPEDAEALGIEDGDPVRVTSRRGSIVADAELTERSAPGLVFMTFAFAEAAANLLTSDELDPIAKIPDYKVTAVKLEKAAVEQPELQPAATRVPTHQ